VAAAIDRLAGWGVPAVPAIDPWQITAEPHYADNELWATVDQPGLGELTLPSPVLGPGARNAPAPGCGEHNGLSELWEPVG
jgi:crotonobetainyl-CoA:carnitine CoA-transferase CaiB-like acyl-CoA transferase